MSLHHNPRIVTEDLMFCLDAANVKSLPDSGAIWYDISKNNRHVTLYSTGGTTYSTTTPTAPSSSVENVKQIDFDGVNDWGYFNDQFLLPSSCTVSAWVKLTDSGTNGIFSHCSGGPVGVRFGVTSGKMQYYYYSGSWLQKTSTSASINNGSWHNIVFAKNTADLKMYVDNELDSTHTVPEQSFYMRCIASGWGPCNSDSYGAGTDNYGQVFAGSIGAIMVHSRQLTTDEISQNFNTHRRRYGI